MIFKRSIIVLAVLLCTTLVHAAVLEPQVSENVELMCISARLAAYEEFGSDLGGEYIKDINEHFKKHKSHSFVSLMKRLRQSNSIGFDAVVSLAIRLERKGRDFSLVEEEEGAGVDSRWEGANMDEFLRLLGDFYKDSKFHEFFESHKSLYNRGLEAYKEEVLSSFDLSWYDDFYAKEQNEGFNVVVCFNNGFGNFGPSRHIKGSRREVFAVVSYSVDKAGKPSYNKDYLSTLVHEFNHSYVNYLLELEGNREALSENGFFLYMSSQASMRQQAYSHWATVINESVVRAAVICYMADHDNSEALVNNLVLNEISLGFRWIPELVACMRKFQRQRDLYPTFESYYPQIVKFFNEYALSERARVKSWNN